MQLPSAYATWPPLSTNCLSGLFYQPVRSHVNNRVSISATQWYHQTFISKSRAQLPVMLILVCTGRHPNRPSNVSGWLQVGGLRVSILTGSEEPVQRKQGLRGNRCSMFQSSPAPKSRCNARDIITAAVVSKVSILTGSEEPVQLQSWRTPLGIMQVSILTGSEEPVQPCRMPVSASTSSFNPHRLRRAGATDIVSLSFRPSNVSILTGSEEPVQQELLDSVYTTPMFQSSPAPKSRCNPRPGIPHPGRRVSILTGSEEPVQQKQALKRRIVNLVSILTGSEEPVQRRGIITTTAPAVFQSSPAPKSRCNPGETIYHDGYEFAFQSSPAPKSRCNCPLCNGHRLLRVSILTGSEEPVQRT